MTAINIACMRHLQCIHVVTDTAHYDPQTGVIHGFATKVRPVPKWPGVVTGRGRSTAGKLLEEALADRFETFDAAVERLAGAFAEMAAGILGAESYELIIAGISKARGGPEAYVFSATDDLPEGCREADRLDADKVMPAAMQLVRLPDLIAGPVPPQDVLCTAKFQPIPLVGHSDDVIAGLRHVIEMQRRSVYPGVSGSRVGGKAELTSILPFGIKQMVLTEWSDKEGEPIEPGEIDWAAWHANNKPPGDHWHRRASTFWPSVALPSGGRDSSWACRRVHLLSNTVQQRIAALGALATVEDKVHATEDSLKLARLSGVDISKHQIDVLKDVTRAQAEWDRVNQSSTVGIFNLAAATRASDDQLMAWEETGVVNAKDAQQLAAAHEVLAEKIKAASDAAALASTPFKQLKQMEIDYADTAKQVDAVATSSLQGIENGLLDLATGSKSASDAFKEMGLSIVKALEDMIIKMAIIQPLAKALQATLSGGISGSGGTGFLGSVAHLFGFAAGGSFTVPSGAGAMALPGFANGADWTVPGSGAPDSKVTAFRVSPGERVTVTPPGKIAGSGVMITQNIIVDGATGNTEIQSMVEAGVSKANDNASQLLKAYDRRMPDRVAAINHDPRRRGA